VPLKWHFCYGSQRGAVLKELLLANNRGLSPALETRAILMEEARCAACLLPPAIAADVLRLQSAQRR
jgi:hypothetical protein